LSCFSSRRDASARYLVDRRRISPDRVGNVDVIALCARNPCAYRVRVGRDEKTFGATYDDDGDYYRVRTLLLTNQGYIISIYVYRLLNALIYLSPSVRRTGWYIRHYLFSVEENSLLPKSFDTQTSIALCIQIPVYLVYVRFETEYRIGYLIKISPPPLRFTYRVVRVLISNPLSNTSSWSETAKTIIMLMKTALKPQSKITSVFKRNFLLLLFFH